MKFWRYLGCTIARICFSIIFLVAGVKKFLAYGAMKASVGSMLSVWNAHQTDGFVGWMVNIIGNYVGFFLILAAVLEVIGGLFILIGIKPRIGAFLLLIFMIPTTIFMHPFWLYDPNAANIQVVMFLKNLAIIGALFFIWAYDDGYCHKKSHCGPCGSSHEPDHSGQMDHHDFPQEPPEEHH